MTKERFSLLESYMLSCADGDAHDSSHVYRVLYSALRLAAAEEGVNEDILIAACLLHDVGRAEQFADPRLCHAEVGAKKAYAFLKSNGWDEEEARKIESCILTHRFRVSREPQSIEAKILFDADKLDVAGVLGVARTLQYKAELARPLYVLDDEGNVCDGENDPSPTFLREYCYKLKKIYGKFYTASGRQEALARRKNAEDFCAALMAEVRSSYSGRELLLFDES